MIQREPDLKQALLQLRPGMIHRVALRTGSRDLAEEVVQVALLKALEGLDGLKDPRRLKSWFGTIVQHSLQDQFRHWSRQAPLEQAESLPDLQAEEKTEPGLSCGCVLQLLPTLRPAYAQLLEAVDLRGDSLQKLAQKWGLSPIIFRSACTVPARPCAKNWVSTVAHTLWPLAWNAAVEDLSGSGFLPSIELKRI